MLASTRFNSNTFAEFERYISGDEFHYCVPVKIKQTVPLNSLLFVAEMNNELNKIMAIGLIRNIPGNRRRIYSDDNYNRYSYEGMARLHRDILEEIDNEFVEILDTILFKGFQNLY